VPQATRPPLKTDEKTIRALLATYDCPVPFHEVRTGFLGSIASPGLSVSPFDVMKNLWGGQLPEFRGLDAANELTDALLNGLWNSLTRHQKRTDPFRLVRTSVPETQAGLAELALIRRQELDGFVEGLFGDAEELDLPAQASSALDTIGEIRAMIVGVHKLASDASLPAEPSDIVVTMKHMRELTRIAENALNQVVLDCTRVRRRLVDAFGKAAPTRH